MIKRRVFLVIDWAPDIELPDWAHDNIDYTNTKIRVEYDVSQHKSPS